MDAICASRLNCPIEMSFDLDEALTLPQDIPSPQTSAVSNSLIILGMPTVVAAATADMCSVCMEAFQPGESGWQVPCGHVYHQACIAAWSVHNNSSPNCRCKIFQEN